MTITRRAFITAAAGMAAASAFPFGEAFAAAPEKKNIKIAVGGSFTTSRSRSLTEIGRAHV